MTKNKNQENRPGLKPGAYGPGPDIKHGPYQDNNKRIMC